MTRIVHFDVRGMEHYEPNMINRSVLTSWEDRLSLGRVYPCHTLPRHLVVNMLRGFAGIPPIPKYRRHSIPQGDSLWIEALADKSRIEIVSPILKTELGKTLVAEYNTNEHKQQDILKELEKIGRLADMQFENGMLVQGSFVHYQYEMQALQKMPKELYGSSGKSKKPGVAYLDRQWSTEVPAKASHSSWYHETYLHDHHARKKVVALMPTLDMIRVYLDSPELYDAFLSWAHTVMPEAELRECGVGELFNRAFASASPQLDELIDLLKRSNKSQLSNLLMSGYDPEKDIKEVGTCDCRMLQPMSLPPTFEALTRYMEPVRRGITTNKESRSSIDADIYVPVEESDIEKLCQSRFSFPMGGIARIAGIYPAYKRHHYVGYSPFR